MSSPPRTRALLRRLMGGPPQQVAPAFPAAPPSPTMPVVEVGEVMPPPVPVPAAPPPPALVPPWNGKGPFAATELLEIFEARRLRLYQDSKGVWTISIGSTRDIDGKPVTRTTLAVTDAQAEVMHRRDLEKAAGLVRSAITAPITTRQAVVLILLANNVSSLSVAATTIGAHWFLAEVS